MAIRFMSILLEWVENQDNYFANRVLRKNNAK